MRTRLRNLREDNDYSQKQIAEMLYIDQSTYSRYENGLLDIPLSILIKLSNIYNVSIDYLIDKDKINI